VGQVPRIPVSSRTEYSNSARNLCDDRMYRSRSSAKSMRAKSKISADNEKGQHTCFEMASSEPKQSSVVYEDDIAQTKASLSHGQSTCVKQRTTPLMIFFSAYIGIAAWIYNFDLGAFVTEGEVADTNRVQVTQASSFLCNHTTRRLGLASRSPTQQVTGSKSAL
jgi:hypothetical protein